MVMVKTQHNVQGPCSGVTALTFLKEGVKLLHPFLDGPSSNPWLSSNDAVELIPLK